MTGIVNCKKKRWLLRKKQDNLCPLCGRHLGVTPDVDLDHIIPRSQGGGNSMRNLQLVHRACNKAKAHAMDAPSRLDK